MLVVVEAVDPAVAAVLAIASLAVAEQLRGLVALALGDDTGRRSGELAAVHHRVEVFGTAILASLVAVATGGVFGLGWGGAVPVRPKDWVPWRRAVVELTAPVVHLLVAAVAWAVAGPFVTTQLHLGVPPPGAWIDPTLRVLALTNLLAAALLLLPLPSLPGGALVGLALDGDRAATWQRWSRTHRAVVGLPVVALCAVGVPAWLLRAGRLVV